MSPDPRLDSSVDSATHYWSLDEFADAASISRNTIKGYLRKGMLPPHAVTVGRVRGWEPRVAQRWIDARQPIDTSH